MSTMPTQEELDRTKELISDLHAFLDHVDASKEEALRIFVFMVSAILADMCDDKEDLEKAVGGITTAFEKNTEIHWRMKNGYPTTMAN